MADNCRQDPGERPAIDSRSHVRQFEAVLQDGFPWLRFPTPMEREFRRHTHGLRLRRSVVCALLALLGFGWLTLTSMTLAPPLDAPLVIAHLGVMALILGSIALGVVCRHHGRVWPQEQMTAVAALAAAAVILWNASTRNSLVGLTHTVALVGIVSFATVIARQQFWYALVTTGIIMGSFLVLITPRQTDAQLVCMHVGLLLGIASMLTLCASYRYERRDRRSYLFAQLEAMRQDELTRTNTRLEALACSDILTGIGNRSGFDRHLAQFWRRAILARHSLALLLVDLDCFKHYNDTHGRPQGDRCLCAAAKLLADVATRHVATAYRVGGAEFALIMAQGTPLAAQRLAETVRVEIRDLALTHEDPPIADRITATVGAAACLPFHKYVGNTATLQKRADLALCRAKAAGPDRAGFVSEREPLDDRLSSTLAAAETAKPLPALPDPEADGELLEALAAHGQAMPRFLRFAAPLERRYRRTRDRQRSRVLVLYTLTGLAVYNGCFFFSRMLVNDIADLAMQWQYGASAVILLVALLGAVPLRARWRDTLQTAGISMIAVGTVFVASLSSAPTAPTLATAAFLIPFFSVVAGGLSFRSSIVMVALTLAGYMFLIRSDSALGGLIVRDYRALLSLISLLILAASYQLEHGARRGFVERLIAKQRRAHLETASQQLLLLSTRDPLTGMSNRRRFDIELSQAWGRACLGRTRLGLLAIDIDDFKQYNDACGHAAGDGCLRSVAAAIGRAATELGSEAFRIGGEEFALLQFDADPDAVRAAATRVHQAVAALNIRYADARSARIVTVSVGAASLIARGDNRETDLMAAADRALNAAKSAGRNRCEFDDASAA